MIDLKDQLQEGLKAHQAGDLATATSTYQQILRVDESHADALHLLGVVNLQAGKHAEAIDLIEKAVEADPSNPIYRNNLGTSYRGLQRFDRAVESFGEALKLNPEYAQAWYNMGCSYEAQKMWEEAAESYRETLKRMPEFSQAWNNLGNVLLKLESPKDARLCFLELIRLQPESPEAYFNLGNTEFALDDLEAAEKAYEVVRRLNPDLSGLNFSLGQLAHQRGNLQDAVKYYEAELERSPQNAKSLLNLGCALHEAGDIEGALRRYQQSAVGLAESCLAAAHKLLAEENYSEAADKFEKALELLPDDLSVYRGGSLAYHKLGNHERSIEIARSGCERFQFDHTIHQHLGLLLHEQGKSEEALIPLRKALELQPEFAEAQYNLGTILAHLGRNDEAVDQYRNSLRIAPHMAGVWNNLGGIHCQNKELEPAEECFRKAIEADPNMPEAYSNLGNVLQGLKRFDEAVESYQKAIAILPTYAEAYRNMAQAFTWQSLYKEAQAAYEKAIEIRPDYFEAWNNLGIVFLHLRDWIEAERCYREALRLEPGYAEARSNLAFLIHMRGDFDTAIEDLQKLLQERDDAVIWNNLAIAFAHKDRISEALEAYKKAAEQDVNYADPHNNMGILYSNMGRMTEAMKEYEKALRLRPDFPEAYNNLGTANQVQGTIEESVAAYRESLRIKPNYAEARSNLLFALNYDVTISPEDLMLEYKAWDKLYGKTETPYEPHVNVPDPNRKLRVGYVSPDFRTHSVAYYIEPIISAHNRDEYDVYAYAQVPNPDKVTARFKNMVQGWRNTCGINDEQLAEMVRRDEIDILVDLTGHTGRNRLPTFALKPAPVQVTYLGYPNTTGLSRIDYRLSDHEADPEGETAWHSEELIRLPHGFLCYQPSMDAPKVNLPPVLNRGYITFGSFNSQSKVHKDVIKLWAQVMHAVPKSRMLIKNRPMADAGIRDRVWNEFEKNGIERIRVDLIGQIAETSHHLSTYNGIDIALDTFPYNGTTTTCESLWMGVPVITLRGSTHASRVGVSLMTRIGLSDLIGRNPEDYVRVARELCNDRQRMLNLRWSLRQRMLESHLCNKNLITRDIETAYRSMWHRWCATQHSSST